MMAEGAKNYAKAESTGDNEDGRSFNVASCINYKHEAKRGPPVTSVCLRSPLRNRTLYQ